MKKLLLFLVLMTSLSLLAQEKYEFSYEYYKEKARKAKRHKKRGVSFTVVGAVFLGGAALSAALIDNDEPAKGPVVGLLLGIGIINTAIGVPLWIVGSMKYKDAQKAMKAVNPSLTLGVTSNGVGLVLRL